MLFLLCGQEYPVWCSLLCLTDFQDGEVCWEDPKYVRREGQAIAVFLMGPGVELDTHRAFKLEKHKDQKCL